jgi:hypothetical protein
MIGKILGIGLMAIGAIYCIVALIRFYADVLAVIL